MCPGSWAGEVCFCSAFSLSGFNTIDYDFLLDHLTRMEIGAIVSLGPPVLPGVQHRLPNTHSIASAIGLPPILDVVLLSMKSQVCHLCFQLYYSRAFILFFSGLWWYILNQKGGEQMILWIKTRHQMLATAEDEFTTFSRIFHFNGAALLWVISCGQS